MQGKENGWPVPAESRPMSDQAITPELRQWIIDQAAGGHPPEAVL